MPYQWPSLDRLCVLALAPLVFLVFLRVAPAASGESVVEIRAFGRYFIEPANLSVTVQVEPNASNRLLRFEADGERVFRASEIALEGDRAKRVHVLQFQALPAGHYVLRAEVHSANSLRGVAEDRVLVLGRETIQ